jgi:hypothetical protein
VGSGRVGSDGPPVNISSHMVIRIGARTITLFFPRIVDVHARAPIRKHRENRNVGRRRQCKVMGASGPGATIRRLFPADGLYTPPGRPRRVDRRAGVGAWAPSGRPVDWWTGPGSAVHQASPPMKPLV